MGGVNEEKGELVAVGELQWHFVAVSDVHLRTLDDDRGRLLLHLMDTVADLGVGRVCLLGDIFDFCLGSKAYFRNKFALLGEKLTLLARTGSEVYFVEGNHEFDLERLGWDAVKFVTGKQQLLRLPSEKAVAITHGDLVYASGSYRIFRALVKSWLSRFIARILPGKVIDGYALSHAKVSRAADDYRSLDADTMVKRLSDWLRDTGAHYGFFGHFHCPVAIRLTGARGAQLMSCRAWDQPNAMAIASTGELYRWQVGVDGRWYARTIDSGRSN